MGARWENAGENKAGSRVYTMVEKEGRENTGLVSGMNGEYGWKYNEG